MGRPKRMAASFMGGGAVSRPRPRGRSGCVTTSRTWWPAAAMRSKVATAKAGVPRNTRRMDGSVPIPGALQLLDFSLHQVALERTDVRDVEPPIEMIGLMQEGARQQIFARLLELFAFGILRLKGDAFAAFHLLAESRDAQAALFPFLLALHTEDPRVDQHQLVVRVFAIRNVDNGDLSGKADLGGGEAHALGGVHGFEHVFQELMQLR